MEKEKLFIYNYNTQVSRAIHELRGIASIIIFDKKIDDNELKTIEMWIINNAPYLTQYPMLELKELFQRIISDGVATDNERAELLNFLEGIADSVEMNPVVEGIFSNPDNIIFNDKYFLFTGEFLFGERELLQQAVKDKGGSNSKNCTLYVNYLVVGSLGSDFYKFGRFGTKITKALQYNSEGRTNILILREKDFVKSLNL